MSKVKTSGGKKENKMQELLALRKKIKSRKPRFTRTELFRHGVKYKRLKATWRRPKGRHSKRRLHKRGALPSPAYGMPKATRGLHPSGAEEVLVRNIADLESAKGKTGIALRIASTVGGKKRLELLEKAKALKLRVLNPSLSKKTKEKVKKKAEKEKAKEEGKGVKKETRVEKKVDEKKKVEKKKAETKTKKKETKETKK